MLQNAGLDVLACFAGSHSANAPLKNTSLLPGMPQWNLPGVVSSLTPVLQSPNENFRRGEKPTFPGQAGWCQCTEMVQDEAWFLDTGNSCPNCAVWEWVYPGEDFSSPGESDRKPTGCWLSIVCQCAHSQELSDSSKGVTRAPLCCWHRLQGGSGGLHVWKWAWVLKLKFRGEKRLSCYVKKGWTCVSESNARKSLRPVCHSVLW